VALALVFAGAAQCNALVERNIVPYDSRFTYHHAHTVVYEHAPADLSSWMNLDSRYPPDQLG
jgi:hypothetical protein